MLNYQFRGKVVMSTNELEEIGIEHENGWVVGNLIQNGGRPWIVGDIIEWDDEYITHEWWAKVYPKSVGQFTGIKDKNGKKIYKGDICTDDFEKEIYVVDFITDLGQWVLRTIVDGRETKIIRYLNIDTATYLEVLGNAFEDSELINERG